MTQCHTARLLSASFHHDQIHTRPGMLISYLSIVNKDLMRSIEPTRENAIIEMVCSL